MSLNDYPSSATLTSSIFDSGFSSNWGTLTYSATTPTNTSVAVKIRTSNSASMTGATDWASCTAISSGSDISANSCVTDSQRYAQYQLTLAETGGVETPTFADLSLAFANAVSPTGSVSIAGGATYSTDRDVTLTLTGSDDVDAASALEMEVSEDSGFSGASYESFSITKAFTLSTGDGTKIVYARIRDTAANVSDAYSDTIVLDTTEPASFDLDSPEDESYTNLERPVFRWQTAATPDPTSGLSKYKLEVDNGDSGDFTIDNITPSRTEDYETTTEQVRYKNFSDSDDANNYISVQTRASSDWGSDSNNGKLKEGKRKWTVIAVDNAGNEGSDSHLLFVDRTDPTAAFSKINGTEVKDNMATNDQTPTFSGKIIDSLSGDSTDNKVAAGPKSVEVKIEKKNFAGTYSVHTLKNINLETVDTDGQTGDKYSEFSFTPEFDLPLGTYRVTISGKDKAGNIGEGTALTLGVTTFDKIAMPEEKKEEKTTGDEKPGEEASPTKISEIVREIRPPKPGVLEVVSQKLASAAEGVYWLLVTGVRQLGVVGGRTLALVGKSGDDAVGDMAFAGVAYIRFVNSASDEGLAEVGQGLVAVGAVGGALDTAAGQEFASLGGAYDGFARRTPGIVGGILLALENTANAGERVVINSARNTYNLLAVSAGRTVQTVGNSVVNALAVADRVFVGVSDSIAQTTTGFAQEVKSGMSGAGTLAQKVQLTATMIGEYWFDREPTKILAVKVEKVTPTSAIIYWQTNHHATSAVNYGFDTSYGNKVQSDERVKEHYIALSNLEPGKTYYFEVMSQNKNYVYDAYYTLQTPME